MVDGYISALVLDAADGESAAATRDRLKGNFPPGSARRMSQLGLMAGTALAAVNPRADDHLIYVTEFGESRSLETFLDSFPNPSPTAFQSSIHPSGFQQALIARQFAVHQFLPMVGRRSLIAQALLTAALRPGVRTVVCGGEEEGTWMRQAEGASDRAFAFAFVHAGGAEGALAHWRLIPSPSQGGLALVDWFDRVRSGQSFAVDAGNDWRLEWQFL